MRAWSMLIVWQIMMTLRRFRPSRKAPVKEPKKSTGIWVMKSTVPSSSGEPVILYTSQFMATRCIHSPDRDTICPI
jgi:hypothetical protein